MFGDSPRLLLIGYLVLGQDLERQFSHQRNGIIAWHCRAVITEFFPAFTPARGVLAGLCARCPPLGLPGRWGSRPTTGSSPRDFCPWNSTAAPQNCPAGTWRRQKPLPGERFHTQLPFKSRGAVANSKGTARRVRNAGAYGISLSVLCPRAEESHLGSEVFVLKWKDHSRPIITFLFSQRKLLLHNGSLFR